MTHNICRFCQHMTLFSNFGRENYSYPSIIRKAPEHQSLVAILDCRSSIWLPPFCFRPSRFEYRRFAVFGFEGMKCVYQNNCKAFSYQGVVCFLAIMQTRSSVCFPVSFSSYDVETTWMCAWRVTERHVWSQVCKHLAEQPMKSWIMNHGSPTALLVITARHYWCPNELMQPFTDPRTSPLLFLQLDGCICTANRVFAACLVCVPSSRAESVRRASRVSALYYRSVLHRWGIVSFHLSPDHFHV